MPLSAITPNNSNIIPDQAAQNVQPFSKTIFTKAHKGVNDTKKPIKKYNETRPHFSTWQISNKHPEIESRSIQALDIHYGKYTINIHGNVSDQKKH